MEKNTSVQQNHRVRKQFEVDRQLWIVCLLVGASLWIVGLILWSQGSIDKAVLFNFNPARVDQVTFVAAAQWISDYGRAAIMAVFVVYLLASFKISRLDAPPSIHLYTLSSYAVSGIATMVLKVFFGRPRPLTTYGDQIEVLRDYISYAMPSGHATNSIALILPFLLFVHHRNSIHVGIKIVITVIAVLVSLSRVVLGAHYVGDVIAGIGNAVLWLPVSMLLANWLLEKVKK